MATLALNSGLWVRRLLNFFGEGFANGGAPFRGGTPPQRLTMGPVQKNQTTSDRRMAYRMLRREGWTVNHKLVQRLWREEGLQRPIPR
jgi:hypothetical protein